MAKAGCRSKAKAGACRVKSKSEESIVPDQNHSDNTNRQDPEEASSNPSTEHPPLPKVYATRQQTISTYFETTNNEEASQEKNNTELSNQKEPNLIEEETQLQEEQDGTITVSSSFEAA